MDITMRRSLTVGGLLLILLGAFIGGIYGGMYLPQVKMEQNKKLTSAFEIVTESVTSAKQEADLYVNKVLFGGRMSNVHAHMTLIGMLSILLSFLLPHIHISKTVLSIGIYSILSSGILLPLGIFLETWYAKTGGYIALTGGLLLTISIFIFLVGVLRSPAEE